MPDSLNLEQKTNQNIGNFAFVMATLAMVQDYFFPAFLHGWVDLILMIGFLILAVQASRQDFGPLNGRHLLKFFLLLTGTIGISYLIYFFA